MQKLYEKHNKPNCKNTFKQGYVITIEHDISIAGWGGICIEGGVLLTEQGLEILTQHQNT